MESFMGMPTAVNQLKKKLEDEAGVVFSKDIAGNHWSANLDGKGIIEDQRTLSQAVWLAARQLGEEV